jgi:nucleoside-diphosphate-sugar epimerase
MVGFDRDQAPYPPPMAECVCVDLTSDESVAAAFERVRYGYGDRLASVVHLAAYYDFSGEPSPKYGEITVHGTERLLGALRGFTVEQFVFSSTMLVHAPTRPGRPISEESPLDPRWPYPESKLETEELIRRQRDAVPAVYLRIAGVYDDGGHSIPLAHQIQRIYERHLTGKVYPGELTHGQAFVHLDDVVDALWRTVERRTALPPEITLLIGEPETLSYDALQRELGRLIHGEDWETREVPKPIAKAGAWLEDAVPLHDAFIKPWMIDRADDHFELDIGRANSLLGWEPRRALKDALPRMVAALEKEPEAFYRENQLGSPPAHTAAG